MYEFISKNKTAAIIGIFIICAVLVLGVESIRYYQFEQYCKEIRARNYCSVDKGSDCAKASGEDCNSFQLF